MKLRIFLMCVAILTVSGCAYVGPQSYRHVIEDKTGTDQATASDNRIGTFALVAERRMVLVKFKDGSFCAEPPPDAVDNLSAALSAGLAADTKSVGASASAAAAVATYAKQLFYRSQGLQLYRDGMFSLCTQYLNGAITQTQMNDQLTKLLDKSAALIQAEIPELKNIKADAGVTPALPSAPALPSPPTPPVPAVSNPPAVK